MLGPLVSSETLDDVFSRLGSADDRINQQVLQQLLGHPELPEPLRTDAKRLHEHVKLWNNPKDTTSGPNRYRQTLEIKAGSRLYPLAQYYYARGYLGYALQYGKIRHFEERRAKATAASLEAFRIAEQAYPDNEIIAMYLDRERQPWPVSYKQDPQAPDWANHQRTILEGLSDVIIWWIEERQQKNGAFTSGRGDDVEMWRWWAPVLVGFEDPDVIQGQSRLSSWVIKSLKGQSYTGRSDDVEHTSEDSTDSILPMMYADPGNEIWGRHARVIGELYREKWTGVNERGFLQFRNLNFTYKGITGGEEKACDTLWHFRAILPTLLLWQQGERRYDDYFLPWFATWVDATAREERGKPAGVIPSAIHWPSGRIGGPGERWWIPEIYPEKLYHWPFHLGPMLQQLLLAWHMSGDESYLAPMHSMALLYREHLANPVANPEPGSRAWCAARLKAIVNIVAKYRVLSGDAQYDDLLQGKGGNAYLKFRITGKRQELTEAFANDAGALSQNFPMYTQEARWCDRVLNRPGFWVENSPLETDMPTLRNRWNMNELYTSVTGDIGGIETFPLRAVRWKTPARNIAALVTHADTGSFTAELYHFGNEPRNMGAEFWLMKPGSYQVSLSSEEGVLMQKSMKITQAGDGIPLVLPATTLVTLKVTPEQIKR